MPNERTLTDDELNNEIAQILPAADRLRLVALDRTQSLAAAKMRSLQRELRIMQAQTPNDAALISQAKRKVELQQLFATQATAEIQRGETPAPVNNPAALVLYGRVVDGGHLGKAGLVVSVIGSEGRAIVFTCTDGNGAFRLDVPADPIGNETRQFVTLLVSDSRQAILYRGTEIFPVEGNKVIFREIVLSDDPGKPHPQPPPPVAEQVIVPDVTGAERARASDVLRRSGLLADEQTTQVEADKVGLVVAQDPKPGTSVKAGSSVTITVGIATESVAVPDVVGGTLAEAAVRLKRAQLSIGAVEPPNPGEDAVVLGQSPKAGTQVARGSSVDLKVRPPITEPPTVEVPDLTRLTAAQARETLVKQMLTLGEVATKATTDNQVGLVLSQKPKAGTKVAPKSAVAIVVGIKAGGATTPAASTAPTTHSRTAAEAIKNVTRDRHFKNVGATEAKLLRIAEEQDIHSEAKLRKTVEDAEDAEVRDRFKLRNLDSARTLKEIVLRVITHR